MWGSVGIPRLSGVFAVLDQRPSPSGPAQIMSATHRNGRRAAGAELLKPAATDVLQRWPVSKRVSSSKAPADDARLIDRLSL
jgi:hypothetical protein